MTTCNARGVAVTIDAAHMCMVMRGVEKLGSTTSSATFLGAFKGPSDAAVSLRAEFFSRCPPAVAR
jgi:GTP cyclohydrolase I